MKTIALAVLITATLTTLGWAGYGSVSATVELGSSDLEYLADQYCTFSSYGASCYGASFEVECTTGYQELECAP